MVGFDTAGIPEVALVGFEFFGGGCDDDSVSGLGEVFGFGVFGFQLPGEAWVWDIDGGGVGEGFYGEVYGDHGGAGGVENGEAGEKHSVEFSGRLTESVWKTRKMA